MGVQDADIENALSNYRIDFEFMTSASTLEEMGCEPIAEESLLLVTPADVTGDFSEAG